MTVTEILGRLEHVHPHRRGWSARCPAHADRSPSLDVATGAEGRVLMCCRAGCRPREIVAAIGLHLSDLFADARPRAQGKTAHAAPVSLLQHARRDVLHEALREPWHAPGVVELYAASDWIRTRRQLTARARAVATAAGDGERAWVVLDLAAQMERAVDRVEAALDEALA